MSTVVPGQEMTVLNLDGARYPALWLRDNCPCPQCADPRSGQKLFSITDLPAEVAIAAVEASDERIEVLFAPGGHRSVFTRAWLAAHRLGSGPAADARAEDAKLLWQAADLASSPPQGLWPRFQQDDAHRESCLDAAAWRCCTEPYKALPKRAPVTLGSHISPVV